MFMAFKITKAHIEAYVNNGYTVRMMAEDITKVSGVKCSDATVKVACKTYGVNLRNKRNPSNFVFEDLDTNVTASATMSDAVNTSATLLHPVEYAQVENAVSL